MKSESWTYGNRHVKRVMTAVNISKTANFSCFIYLHFGCNRVQLKAAFWGRCPLEWPSGGDRQPTEWNGLHVRFMHLICLTSNMGWLLYFVFCARTAFALTKEQNRATVVPAAFFGTRQCKEKNCDVRRKCSLLFANSFNAWVGRKLKQSMAKPWLNRLPCYRSTMARCRKGGMAA